MQRYQFFQTDPIPILGSEYLPIPSTKTDTSTTHKLNLTSSKETTPDNSLTQTKRLLNVRAETNTVQHIPFLNSNDIPIP